jgi:hypothetical protein
VTHSAIALLAHLRAIYPKSRTLRQLRVELDLPAEMIRDTVDDLGRETPDHRPLVRVFRPVAKPGALKLRPLRVVAILPPLAAILPPPALNDRAAARVMTR